MKTIAFAVGVSVVASLGISTASAQQATPVVARLPAGGTTYDTEVDLIRKDLRAQKKVIVATNLPLTPEEAQSFWPVYEQYTTEIMKVNDQRYALIKEYAAIYDTMTDSQASSFIKRWTGVDQDAANLRIKYIPLVEKVLPEKKAAMFFQIDRRLGLLIELQLASQLPLVSQ